ncbi:MAG: type II toxin-antitoxin system death-on-curing family toxin [Deltaproteobacteria bacterium]|nr:type II toxin-antitoxin system death-on-curing family toxin [bacterium]MCB9475720.1 type II toxin-antitoxin system death-on-curing family toxin [Deltaproteobacteria bacterium]MCB9479242.1 type II toxin-antitoxin system death-on-curing family toxin [Deltaproteobacteria bacterium]MCB9490122.1 type II toxin-antitoxin system death-on-curing family toxin [Deltaproteobacteria bacterium]
MKINFLSVENVLQIQRQQLEEFGGIQGVRDLRLLESAVAQPQAAFGDQYLHGDLFEMAAAYLFHIASNHPFLDGNKRAGFVSAVVFLDINGIELDDDSDDYYDLVIRVAQGQIGKPEIAEFFRKHGAVREPSR